MEDSVPGATNDHSFNNTDRRAVYEAILTRRDVRGQFLPGDVPDDVMSRLLIAAHHAPSVGFMQPWTFVVIRERETRQRIKSLFDQANAEATEMFPEKRQSDYQKLKLEGILDAPVNLCITCDRNRAGPVVLGRTHIPETDLYSTVCAAQNLWLAARAEGVGVGWVSIVDEQKLSEALGLPEHVVPVAYLCIGYVSEFLEQPELQKSSWRDRLSLSDLVVFDRWNGEPSSERDHALKEAVRAREKTVGRNRHLDDFD